MAAAGPRLPFAWQAQCSEPPHFPFAWQAQYTEFPGGIAAQYTELPGGIAARWPPLARGCLLPGRRSTQSFLAELRRGGPRLPFAWQAQYTERSHSPFVWQARAQSFWRSCGAVAAAGPRLPFAWQAQYSEPPRFPCAWQAQCTEFPGIAAQYPELPG